MTVSYVMLISLQTELPANELCWMCAHF